MSNATFTENFNTFTGSGFAPIPSLGQLDSDLWIISGLSDGRMTYGDTRTSSGDFAGGQTSNRVTTGGVYAFSIASGNNAFGVQPAADDFTPGAITLRLQNVTNSLVDSITLSYIIRFRNDQNRANSLNFSYSRDGNSFTAVSSLDFITPGNLDSSGWQSVTRSITLSGLSIAANSNFFLRWTGDDVSGSGNRDEYAIDDIAVTGLAAPGTVVPPTPTLVKIHEIQGTGLVSPILNQLVTVEAIVVGDFQGNTGLSGFYLQEEDSDSDSNPLTSEGLFVFEGNIPIINVIIGDKVRITGTVSEFGNAGVSLTQLSSITEALIISNNNPLPTAATISNLSAANAQPQVLEAFEGMRTTFAETLSLTEYFQLGRFGSVVLSSGGRLQQPTNVTNPGTDANTLQASNNLRRITLDDGSNLTFPTTLFGRGGNPLSSSNILRAGDAVTGLTGVLDQRFGVYRVQNNQGVDFQAVNNRSETPANVGGRLKIASYNVLNYFTTIADGTNNARGANSINEFQRQEEKLVTALIGLDADVFGLIELENNGDGAISKLVNALNAVAGAGTYAFIPTGTIGTDAIKVGIIYKPAQVTPVGDFKILDSSVDPRFDDTRNRPALAQAFQEVNTGAKFNLVVNHLKSKGQSGLTNTSDPNFDQGDGQGFWNASRTNAALALKDWIATDPTNSGDGDYLIIGDLNAYAQEDPIRALESAGYTNLVGQFGGINAYSYVFDGQAGYLDHALANASLASQVTGVTEWHINADEPSVFDYDDNIVDPGENPSNPPLNPSALYQINPYRTSDHDPVLIGLNLTTPQPFKLQLFHFSDNEGGISALDDAPRMSAVLNALRQQDIDNDGVAGFANTLTLASGDAYIPGLFFGASEQVFGGVGRGDIQILNNLGVQANAFGNHEFDQGTAVVRNLILPSGNYPGTNFPYLSSNLNFAPDTNLASLVTADGQEASTIANKIAKSTVITLPEGQKIGIVGATTPILRSISSPGNVGVSPANPDDLDALAAIIQASVDALLAANPGMNKVVLLAHMQQLSIEQTLAERLRNVDIIVAGGSHTRLTDENDRLRAGDTFQGVYPIVKTNPDGKPVAVVNTDANYKYLGRLVIDFDSNGHIIPESYNPNISGAYATDAQGVTEVGGTGLEDPEIRGITNSLREVINAQEGNFFGFTRVFLNGQRSGTGLDGVRQQETNLGNITADANLAEAKTTDANVVISLKNGGGIRNSIGSIIVPTGTEAVRVAPEEVPGVKPAGGISEVAIKNALSFNNSLSLTTVTASELKGILEYGLAASTNDPANSQGRFPQVGGMAFSFDLDDPAGSRIKSLVIKDENGTVIDVVAQNGAIVGDANRSFRMVTLSFLLDGGDGYTIPQRNRVNLLGSTPNFTGNATFAPDGTEQDAFAEYLRANFFNQPFLGEDVSREFDTRLQNLNFRSDEVLRSTRSGTAGIDNLVGTTGDDVLVGFQGRDTLTGLGGNDFFVYVSLSDRSDTITDFTVGSDKIVLTQLLNSLNYTGSNPIADGYITFTGRGSSTVLNIDTDGFGTAASPLSLALINNVAVAALNNLANFLF
jgi:predicted extracellular nuclease/2',3'-cyclic-nucleotide 2'-phosphodiesterase (5'-nucleotidase family)